MFGHLRSFKGWIQTEVCVIPSYHGMLILNYYQGATCILKIAEDLGQILVVLHTLLVIIEMTPCLNKQSVSDWTGRI